MFFIIALSSIGWNLSSRKFNHLWSNGLNRQKKPMLDLEKIHRVARCKFDIDLWIKAVGIGF